MPRATSEPVLRAAALSALLSLASPSACADDALPALGRALFLDVNLSAGRTQSCASCHDPARAFTDGRGNGVGGAASLGADGVSLGTRNAPSILYAALIPPYRRAADGAPIGGLFLDGRADSLAAQAAEPLTDPREMALPDRAAVIARVAENPAYVAALEAHFGAGVMASTARAMRAVTAAIAAFERAPPFLAFDSRYDRYLRGEYEMTALEDLGRRLYFSDLTNCMQCHLLEPGRTDRREPFTDYRYHNIGVPANPALPHAAPDAGLAGREDVDDPRQAGKFRTPSLRNVAVTAPYMHNGVFRELETAIKFYNRHIVSNAEMDTNPETGRAWGPPEVADTVDRELLRRGQPLDDARVAALAAFLRTLTDRRYERLLQSADAQAAPADAAKSRQEPSP